MLTCTQGKNRAAVTPDLAEAFARQRLACRRLGSPFMAALMEDLPELLSAASRLAGALDLWDGDLGPSGASVPLRIAAGLHALALTGRDRRLAEVYPPAHAGRADVRAALSAALARHDGFLETWVQSPPQTNETGRSGVLLPVASLMMHRFGLPLRLSELGASAGLNLLFDRYALHCGNRVYGDPASPVRLCPDWQGAPPRDTAIVIAERRGVDLHPLDPVSDAWRLLAYVWPDQPERLARMRAACGQAGPRPDKGTAEAWLGRRLATPWPGQCHLVFHTIAYQYFPPAAQRRIEAAMAARGARASADAPLAWFSMEADGASAGAALTLRLWPGETRHNLGRAGFHGEWVAWASP